MITKYITEVHAKFNPLSRHAKACRVFISAFGPNAWRTMKFKRTILPQDSREPNSLYIKFWLSQAADGKELSFNEDSLRSKTVAEQVDRHARILDRKAELAT